MTDVASGIERAVANRMAQAGGSVRINYSGTPAAGDQVGRAVTGTTYAAADA